MLSGLREKRYLKKKKKVDQGGNWIDIKGSEGRKKQTIYEPRQNISKSLPAIDKFNWILGEIELSMSSER